MRTRSGRIGTVVLILLAAFAGAVLGLVVAVTSGFGQRPVERIEHWPLPHHIAKYPGGVTLRYAMVHDTIHERFPRHGAAYYEERNRRTAAALETEKPKRTPANQPTPEYFALVDDLGVGLVKLGKHEEAVQLLREKLIQQKSLDVKGRELYGAYANLGTFLILWQLSDGFADVPRARERIRESIRLVHQAIVVNPESHFGREVWQAVVEEFLLALLDEPELVLKYDMLGNRLDRAVDPQSGHGYDPFAWSAPMALRGADRFLKQPEADQTPEARKRWRTAIAEVGGEDGWKELKKTSQPEPVPFDEPVLGIIGMWRYGGGANPHFSLALAETMLRVGQRRIAWCAYERAAQMAQHTGPEAIALKFTAHCRQRQATIETTLPADETATLRPKFVAELKHGQDYQKAYQEHEAAQISAGKSIDDPHFYGGFHAKHGSIASPVGEEDTFKSEHRSPVGDSWPIVLLFAGAFAFGVALLLRWKAGRVAG